MALPTWAISKPSALTPEELRFILTGTLVVPVGHA